jgi:hypothetical protein
MRLDSADMPARPPRGRGAARARASLLSPTAHRPLAPTRPGAVPRAQRSAKAPISPLPPAPPAPLQLLCRAVLARPRCWDATATSPAGDRIP